MWKDKEVDFVGQLDDGPGRLHGNSTPLWLFSYFLTMTRKADEAAAFLLVSYSS